MTSEADQSSKILYQKALNTAVRLLTRRDHSTLELTQKLCRRGIQPVSIDRVIAECTRLNYLDDERTAGVLIRQLNRKGFGLKRIRLELIKKGLKGRRIEGILSQSLSEADERESAERILQKYRQKFDREKDDLRRRDKIYRFLYARGFAEDIISDLLQRFCQPLGRSNR